MDVETSRMNGGGFYKLVFYGSSGGDLAWMSFRLSHRIFLIYIQSRSPLRSFMKLKNLRHDRQKSISS